MGAVDWALYQDMFDKTVYEFLQVTAVYPNVTQTVPVDTASVVVTRLKTPMEIEETSPGAMPDETAFVAERITVSMKTYETKFFVHEDEIADRRFDTIALATTEMGRVLAEKIDTDLFSKLVSDAGVSAAASVSWDTATAEPIKDLRKLKLEIEKNRGKPTVIIMNSENYEELWNDPDFISAREIAQMVITEGYVDKVLGCKIYATPLMPEGTVIMLDTLAVNWYEREKFKTEIREDSRLRGAYLFGVVRGNFEIIRPQLVGKLTGC